MSAVLFEGYERRIKRIQEYMTQYGLNDLGEADQLCLSRGVDVRKVVRSIQPIAFDDAVWAYILGCAIALKEPITNAPDVARAIGVGLQAFCIPGTVADSRKIGIGHGELAAMLLCETTRCFCILAGHDSFAAAESAIGIAGTANIARKTPLRLILNGLGKDAAEIIARINGFKYIQTKYSQASQLLTIIDEKTFSNNVNSKIRVYGANDANEGVAIMKLEKVDISITGNSTNATRFQHLVAGIYKKWAIENGHRYFSVASGGGTGRTLHPDNIGAGPASYGLTDSMGRMHGDVQLAGSSSVPAHVEMMGFVGMGNNPLVGATVALSVAVYDSAHRNQCHGLKTAHDSDVSVYEL